MAAVNTTVEYSPEIASAIATVAGPKAVAWFNFIAALLAIYFRARPRRGVVKIADDAS